jgi:hypothetical protein
MPAIMIGMVIELAVVAAIWLRYRERAKPFLVAGVFILARMATMGLMSDAPLLRSLLTLLGHTPSGVVIGLGFAIGAVTSWAGWIAGQRPVTAKRAVAQAA